MSEQLPLLTEAPCKWSKRCLGLAAGKILNRAVKTPAGMLDAVTGMRRHGTLCKRHAIQLLDEPRKP